MPDAYDHQTTGEADLIDFTHYLNEPLPLRDVRIVAAPPTIAEYFGARARVAQGPVVEDAARRAAVLTTSGRDPFGIWTHRFEFQDGSVLDLPAYIDPADWRSAPAASVPWNAEIAWP